LRAASSRFLDSTIDRRLRLGADLLRLPPRRGVTAPIPHVPKDPEFESRVRASFDRQNFMSTLGARLVRVEPGEVDVEVATRDDLVQQHGFLHAGVVASAADSACGYAALSLMPAGVAVLSIEFKTNLLAPATGDRIVARARVIRAGRTVTVCWADVMAYARDSERLVATMVATMMTVRDRGLSD
jgi:uncharacterized protein (TIGR00369 family)